MNLSKGPNFVPVSLLFALVIVTAVAAFAPATALARTTRPFESSFGSFSDQYPKALTVDQSNGDVYVIESNTTVSRFDASGAPKNFTAGTNAGTNTLSGLSNPAEVAVDNSGGALSGDIYIADRGSRTVKAFSNSGASLGALTGSGTSEGNLKDLCGVAVDQANGDVYITRSNSENAYGKIWRYVQNSTALPIGDSNFTVTGVSSGRDCGIAVNSGNVYVIESYASELDKYSVSSFAADAPIAYPDRAVIDKYTTAVAVDAKTEEVYADEGDRIQVFDPSGAPLYSFGFAADFGTDSAGIAVKSAPSGAAVKAYIADQHAAGRQIDVFGSPTNVPLLTHRTVATFGKDGTPGTSFSPGLDQLAFDQATRTLFALDPKVPGVYGFDAFGPPAYPALGGFSPLAVATAGDLPGLAVDSSGLGSTGNLYYVSQSTDLLYGFDSNGAALSGFPVDPAVAPGAPDGSPKDLCGTAVDSAGNVWVANSATKRILKYSAAGAPLLGSVDTSAQGSPCRLAFDSNDNLYVGIGGVVWRYSASSGYTTAASVDSSDSGSNGLRAFSVAPASDHLYVAHTNRVDEYDDAGGFVDEFATRIAGASFRGITVDAANGNLYLSDAGNGQIRVLGPGVILPEVAISPATGATNTTAVLHASVGAQGVALTDCHFEYVSKPAFNASGFGSASSVPCDPAFGSIPADFNSHAVSGSVTGLTSSTAYRFRLVAGNATAGSTSTEAEFTTPGRPIVETVGAPMRTSTAAQLGGRVDPRAAAAIYYFEYGTQGPCDANPCTATPSQPAGSGDVTELVSEEIEGLEPNTTYHYRLVADNVNPDGPAFGADMTVTTRASEAPLSHGHFPGPPGSDRAYEQVSPPETGGNPVNEAMGFSADGNRSVYAIAGGTPLSDTGNIYSIYFAQRTESAPHEGGWRPKAFLPPRGPESGSSRWKAEPDATLSSMIAGNSNEVTQEAEIWHLDPEGPPAKLFSGPLAAYETGVFAISADGSRLMADLTGSQDPEHPVSGGHGNVGNFYDLTSGAPHLASLLPDGSVPPCGVDPSTKGVVSSTGSQLYFTTSSSPSAVDNCGVSKIYLRDLDAKETKLLSPAPISGPECAAAFLSATPNFAFLWSKGRLSADDTTPSSCANNGLDGDVYRVELGSGALKCVTCVAAGQDADVYVRFDGISETISVSMDGSRVYFKSPNALVAGASTTGVGGSAYRLNVNTGDLALVGGPDIALGNGARLTPDGATVIFTSSASFLNPLNGSDNGGTRQYYRYEDRDRSLTCLSCPLDGSPPRKAVEGLAGSSPISDDGKDIAFTTATSLVNADQNAPGPTEDPERGLDVYEWRDGKYLLVTDGLTNTTPTTGGPSVSGLSADGRDLYFIAPAQYTPDALDGYRRLYDARIGGGFFYPVPPPPCPLEVCQGTPKGAPEEQAPGTGTFGGPGNLKPRQAKHKKHRAKKRHHKQAKRHAKHRANDNRRTAR